MASDRTSKIVTFVQRVLDWLACLIGRKKATAQPASPGGEGTAQSWPKVDGITYASIPPPSRPIGAEQPREQRDAAGDDSQEKAVEGSGEVDGRAFDKTTGTPEQDGPEHQRDTSSQAEIEPTGDSGSSLPPSPPLPTYVGSDKHEKTLNEMPSAPGGSDLVAPDTHTPEKVESEQRGDVARKGPEDEAGDREGAGVAPENRGGRPRRLPSNKDQPSRRRKLRTTPRPEIICWKREREWVVGVEIPYDISQDSSIFVLQGDDSLSEDCSRAACWPLAKLNTAVNVQFVDDSDNEPIEILLGDDDWLLFKLSGNQLDRGRKVKQVSSGSYLAIVPDTWDRDEEKAGSAPTTPEPVFLDGYLAHFFELTERASSCIAFRDDRGTPIVIGSGGAQFRLAGQEIQDASERQGALFGGVPPVVQILNTDWSSVGTIVIGQEGSGQQRWRESFNPKPDQAEQELPQELLKRKAGWYFLRFYDLSDTLIDSLDFRFVAGLKGISIATAGPAPSPDGHVERTVKILHDAGYSVTPSGQECLRLHVECGAETTILTIPPSADCDLTYWLIRPLNGNGQDVRFGILIERIWWALSGLNTEPTPWRDKPLPLAPDNFAAASDMAIWVRFPKPRWVSNVSAGFSRARSRKFPVKVTDSSAAIPLRDFSGTQELDDRAGEHQFKVWLEIGQGTYEVTVAVLRGFDLASIPSHRLAAILTRLRRATSGPTRQLIKEVRKKYRRAARARPERNVEFVKEGLCLIAILSERTGHEHLSSPRLSDYWTRNARLARREFPDVLRELANRYNG